MTFDQWGAWAFGVVIGWVTYRTLRRKEGTSALSDIATVVGAVGGATVLAIWKTTDLFAAYSIGLAFGFFLYFVISIVIDPSKTATLTRWMGD